MADFVMPTLGSDMTEGTLVEWKKNVGDRVIKGEIIAEVDTEKSAIEVESFYTGVIQQFITQPGDTVPVGTVMAVIREEGKPIEQCEMKTEAKPVKQSPPSPVTGPIISPPSEPGRLRISPAAKQLVAELHLDPRHRPGWRHHPRRCPRRRSCTDKRTTTHRHRPPDTDPGDYRRRHGAIKAGDSPLLLEHYDRLGAGHGLAQGGKPEAPGHESAALWCLID